MSTLRNSVVISLTINITQTISHLNIIIVQMILFIIQMKAKLKIKFLVFFKISSGEARTIGQGTVDRERSADYWYLPWCSDHLDLDGTCKH